MIMARQTRKEIQWIAVDDLLLDPENPRLTIEEKNQKSLLRYMIANEGLFELAASFAKSGYFVEEPIVVVKAEKSPTRYIVVEGNRRVSALKLLLDEDLRDELIGRKRRWPKLDRTRKRELEEIPAIEYDTRAEVIPFLGFRHITGIKTWDSFAKAKYVAQLIESGMDISGVEERIGDSESTVKKYYQAYVVYDQLKNEVGFPVSPLRKDFSRLQVVLGQRGLKEFLGVPRRLPSTRIEEVVPQEKIDELEQVATWVYGNEDEDRPAVVSDTRQITKYLAHIVKSEEAIRHLEEHGDIEAAYEYSDGEKEYCLKKLISAEKAAKNALTVLSHLKEEEDIQRAVYRLSETVASLVVVAES